MERKNCILLVDDEKEICEKIGMAFELEDFKVLIANSGNEAITVIENNPDIDIIISDVRMPDGDGKALVEYLKKSNLNNLPIIMQSGFSEISKEEFIQMGASAFFDKPTKIDDLIEFVKSLLESE